MCPCFPDKTIKNILSQKLSKQSVIFCLLCINCKLLIYNQACFIYACFIITGAMKEVTVCLKTKKLIHLSELTLLSVLLYVSPVQHTVEYSVNNINLHDIEALLKQV